MAWELGLDEGTLGRWANQDRRARDGQGSVSENERDELDGLWHGERRAGDRARYAQALGCPLGRGSDAAVSLAMLIAAHRAELGVPCAVSCRGAGVSQAWFHK